MNKYSAYLNKKVRIITKIIFRNNREINTKYFGFVTKCTDNEVIIKELDGNVESIKTKHIKRIEEIR